MSTIVEKLNILVEGFLPVLYASDDPDFENRNLEGSDEEELKRYQFWEWPHGVGLFGLWKLFDQTKEQRYLDMLIQYYDERLAQGLPGKNINTMAPILALSYLAEHTGNKAYLDVCKEWAEWACNGLDRTKERGFQHRTSDDENVGELWDDTLMMTVLAVANIGRIIGRQDYIDEAVYQFLLHTEYLCDKKTGLWYHGWTFEGNHNFAEAFWARGNCWITIAFPLFMEMMDLDKGVHHYLKVVLERQIKALAALQADSGMWHTLLDDPTSYVETSATAGFGYGILKAIHDGLVSDEYLPMANKAVEAVLGYIDDKGVVQQVSYGTPMGRESKNFYKDIPIRPMPYGQAAAMLILLEANKDIK
ncbi:glycoside hydrolase family 88/105 protein [Spirochaeta cellobiosiphila]|uniref:beta-galactosidase BglB n=1 Tax=Spirochaeta cellobiosiphila TaxID=504483 RepID=UPI00041BD70A|nr:glycoside hydrolase family 88 protein [Spirochaeta cellobiosiphila]